MPYALGCSPSPQALSSTLGCFPAPQALLCSPGSAMHPGLSPALRLFAWQVFLSSRLWSSKQLPRVPPHPLCSGRPRLVLAMRWHGIPITLGTQAVQPGTEGLAGRDGHLSPHQPLPSTFLQVRRPKFVQAQFDFSAHDGSQLPFLRGDIIEVLDCPDPNWWQGKIYGRVGLFPRNYVHPIRK